jgi:UDP-N-acetyl-alpha-D-muramoyl-L-alanyl-L-glutamate epimerase
VVAHPAFSFDTFSFTRRAIEGRRVRLGYALISRDRPRVDIEETLDLPESLGPLVGADDPAVARALLGAHLAAGTSYWKTCVPRELVVEGASLTGDDARFWSEVYTLGLGEFFYRNGIDPSGRAVFRAASGSDLPAAKARDAAPGPTFLLWGGGKDSVVSHEVLKAAGEAHELLSIGRPEWEWVRRSATLAGVALHVVSRRLDPKLHEMNIAGALNGHVPVSAILASVGTLVALLTSRPAVIASNEASASFGNTAWHGIDVNHQWSKSLAFERSVRAWLRRNVPGGPEYASLLRPLSELRIMKAFVTHPEYFGAVTSCNAGFKQSGPASRRFCLTCPKCVFVSLMARPWLDDAAYHALFGGDALADPANVTLVEELLGIRGTKPFECVGTPDETMAALHLARLAGRTIPHGVMTAFNGSVAALLPDLDAIAAAALTVSPDHELSARRIAQLDDYLHRH